jgi:peroxiredoxin
MKKEKKMSSSKPGLSQQCAETTAAFLSQIPEEHKELIMQSLEKLMNSEAGDAAPREGDRAPDFSLPNVKGGDIKLSDKLEQGPVVLNFYRGGWCPFCNLEFNALQQKMPEMEQFGASLIGISPETPDNSLSTIEKNNLVFDVLSDEGNRVARDFGLVMTVYEEIRPLYHGWGIDLPATNGDDSYELPLPATYVIDQDGIIQGAYINKNYTQRMEPDEVIRILQDMRG